MKKNRSHDANKNQPKSTVIGSVYYPIQVIPGIVKDDKYIIFQMVGEGKLSKITLVSSQISWAIFWKERNLYPRRGEAS